MDGLKQKFIGIKNCKKTFKAKNGRETQNQKAHTHTHTHVRADAKHIQRCIPIAAHTRVYFPTSESTRAQIPTMFGKSFPSRRALVYMSRGRTHMRAELRNACGPSPWCVESMWLALPALPFGLCNTHVKTNTHTLTQIHTYKHVHTRARNYIAMKLRFPS